MSDRQKTAKDIAWDRERQKYRTTISKLKSDIAKLEVRIDADYAIMKHDDEIIAEQERIIKMLQEKMNLSNEDIRALVDHEKKSQEAYEMFKILTDPNNIDNYMMSSF